MKKILFFLFLLAALFLPQNTLAVSEHYYDDDFIIASVVIANPSADVLYSALGHACIRMQCPSEGLDYCFSYESEDAKNKIFSFLMGKLKMGMFAVPIQEYIDGYKEEQRGVYEYPLHLPLEIRRELWRVLDEELVKGPYLDYDYFNRGCAISSLHFIERACGVSKIQYGPWGGRYEGSTRERVYEATYGNEWFRFIVAFLAGYDRKLDGDVRNSEKLSVPLDLVHVLQNATIDGHPVLSNECHVLNESGPQHQSGWCTPQLIAALLLLLAIANLFISKPYMDWFFLGIQTAFAVVMTYLLVFSRLPLTDWNWLIIPYNLLPAIAWHWRKYWALPYAGLMLIWLVVISIWPHLIIPQTHYLFVIVWILVLLKNSPIRLQFTSHQTK